MAISYGSLLDAVDFVRAPDGIYLSASRNMGIAAVRGDDSSMELMQRALFAINKASFPKDSAAQAVSAIGELESNILAHSRDEASGLVAFEVNERFVGIYASDQGVGVINSLRRNPTFAALDDSGEALQLALQEGVSSSAEPGRGMGFRPIFVGLASLSALLRFRSGDSLLEINGFGDGPPTQELRERADIPGFHAFVHCTFGQ
jgi:hypothetical protein